MIKKNLELGVFVLDSPIGAPDFGHLQLQHSQRLVPSLCVRQGLGFQLCKLPHLGGKRASRWESKESDGVVIRALGCELTR